MNVWYVPRNPPRQVTHEAPAQSCASVRFFSSVESTNCFSIFFFKSFHTAVTAELETWLKTLRTNLRIIALPPLTPDSPTRTRPGTAGPIIWVRPRVKVKELSTYFSASEMKPKHYFSTKQEPECLFYEILKVCRTAVCTWLLELLPSPNPVEVCRPLNLGPDLNSWHFQLLMSFLTDYHRCQKALDAKGVDTAPCDWYKRVYKSLCPMSWVTGFYSFNVSETRHSSEFVQLGSNNR